MILTVAVFLRVYHLDADLPFWLSPNMGESIDWTWYLQPSLVDLGMTNADASLVSYNQPLLRVYQTYFLKLFHPNLDHVGLLSLLPGILLLIAADFLARAAETSLIERLAVFALVSLNFYLVMYSRMPGPYLWIALVGVLAPVLWRRQPLLAVTMIVFAALTLKFVCLIYLPLLLGAHWLENGGRDRRVFTMAGIGTAVGVIAYFVLPPVHRITQETIAKISFYGRGFSSLTELDLQLRLFIRELRQTVLPSSLWLGLGAYCGFFLLLAVRLKSARKVTLVDGYCGLVFMVSLGMLLFLRYRPIRHTLVLMPACSLLAVRLPHLWKSLRWRDINGNNLWVLSSAFSWLPVYRLSQWTLPLKFLQRHHVHVVWLWLIVSLVSLALGWLLAQTLHRLKPWNISPALAQRIFLAYITVLILPHFWAYLLWSAEPTYTLQISRNEVNEIIPRNAVVIGPYAHLLTMNTGRLAFKLQNPGVADVPSHLLIDSEVNVAENAASGIDFNRYELLERLYVRGFEVRVYRLPDTHLERSAFEKANQAYLAHDTDIARVLWEASANQFPASGASSRALLALEQVSGAGNDVLQRWHEQALRRNPFHPFPWLAAAIRADGQGQQNIKMAAIKRAEHFAPHSEFLRDSFKPFAR